MDDITINDLLVQALGMEEKGHAFYLEQGIQATNKIVRETFKHLADGELTHIDNIKKYVDELKDNKKLHALKLSNIKKNRKIKDAIFSSKITDYKNKIRNVDDDKKACEFAMEFEKAGYAHYENMLNRAEDKNLKDFLKFLLEEESEHYNKIMQMHSFISDSKNWYMNEEGSFPQG